jgi:DNA polymerase-1
VDISLEGLRKDSTVAVIDGNSLLHRAFHAVPLTMNAPDGRPTNACFGFISMLLKLVDDYAPNAIVCAFDSGIPSFRTDVLKDYKAQRPPIDPLLKEQFPMIKKLLVSLDIPVVEVEGWEGDDILGTLAARNASSERDMILVTGDKDALQLVTEEVSVLTTRKGLSDVVVYDPDKVFERWGIGPAQVPDFLALQGDSSDNIPGVPGIGPKTATKLLQQYGSLDEVIAHADQVKGKMGERLRENVQSALDSRVVATISHDVPIDIDLDAVRFPSFDPATVREAFEELRMMSHLSRILAMAPKGSEDRPADSGDAVVWGDAADGALFVVSPYIEGEDAEHLLDEVVSSGEMVSVWLQGEEDSLFADGGLEELFLGTRRGVACFVGERVVPVIVRLFQQAHITTLDSKALLAKVIPADTARQASMDIADFDPSRVFDLTIASYLLDSEQASYSLSTLASIYLEQLLLESESPRRSGCIAAACSLALAEPLSRALEEDGSFGVFKDIEMPLVPVLVDMERVGVDLDQETLARLQASTAAEISDLTLDIHRLAGEEFNVDSPKQLGEILFEKLGLPAGKRTKRGYSTDASVLSSLVDKHPLPEKVLAYRELAKMQSTYIEALPRLLGEDGRLHTTFNQTKVATGRLSSSDPNLQNIPVRTEFGRHIREAFAPQDPSFVFLSADYSQIELRLLAHLSADKGLVDAFRSGDDFHSLTASRVFGVPAGEVTPEMRSRAKAVNFGIVYGQQAFGLGKSLHIPYREAQAMIDQYFEAYPQVNAYLQQLVDDAREMGYVSTMFGRKRRIPEIHSRNQNLRAFGERTAINHPMQGSAADIIKMAMIQVAARLREEGLSARFCLQVHDELDFECPADEVEALTALVDDVMSHVVKLRVPLVVSVASGPTWAQAK